MPEEIICDDCGQAITVEDGKHPNQVLRGHKIHCKGKMQDKMKEEETFTREDRPKERPLSARKERIPFGVPRMHFRNREDDGFVYRIFNDNWAKEPGRIQRAKMAGYEEVDEPDARQNVGTNDDGSAITGVLMRIPKEFYDEDQAKKQEAIDETDRQIQGGSFTEKRGDKRYIPRDGGIRQEIKFTP